MDEKNMKNLHNLIIELSNFQVKMFDGVSDNELKEANQIAEELIKITKEKYDDISEKYAIVRGMEPTELDKKIWKKLLDLARIRVKSGKLGDIDGSLTLLDIATGYGRDIRYASKIPDLKIIGIDNSDGFIKILKDLENTQEIPIGSYRKADMRYLSCFPSGSFDIVRHNASLIHLPVIGKGYMADLSLSESYRVLKDNGLIYISVKEGKGLINIDTDEGFGERFFQLYTIDSIKNLVFRNGFLIHSIWKGPSSHNEKITWIHMIAEKVPVHK